VGLGARGMPLGDVVLSALLDRIRDLAPVGAYVNPLASSPVRAARLHHHRSRSVGIALALTGRRRAWHVL